MQQAPGISWGLSRFRVCRVTGLLSGSPWRIPPAQFTLLDRALQASR